MIYGIIPARLNSTRLPRKLLLAETGKPLIRHTLENVWRARMLDCTLIATDSPEIAAAGGDCAVMTGDHPSGTDRIAEVARSLPNAELIVNIQGDEPEIDPEHIDTLVLMMIDNPAAEMGTLATPITPEQLPRPSCVKVIVDSADRAILFTRDPVRHSLRHIGVYAYRPAYLQWLTRQPPTAREQAERLEQLRALEAGATILVATVDHAAPGIDTPEDYAAFVERCHACV